MGVRVIYDLPSAAMNSSIVNPALARDGGGLPAGLMTGRAVSRRICKEMGLGLTRKPVRPKMEFFGL